MPETSVSNPRADFSGSRQRKKGSPGEFTRPRKNGMGRVDEKITVRYKKKRPARSARRASRSALTIQLDSERPIPKF